MSKKPSRKRRKPEEAKDEILNAANAVLNERGPAELKFEAIAKRAGVSKANISYHFGTIAEVKRALLNRGLSAISNSVAQALFTSINDEQRPRIEATVHAVFEVMQSQQSIKTLAWLLLSPDTNQEGDFVRQLKLVQALIVYNLPKYIPEEDAHRLASMIVFQVLVVASGEALLGNLVRDALGNAHGDLDGKKLLIDTIFKEISQAEVDKLK